MQKFNVIILAADGPSFGEKDLPSCLQSLKGGNNLLDYQIRTLNLCGIESDNIYIVIGQQGVWNKTIIKESLKKYSKKNLVINKINEFTSSEESFLLALDKLEKSYPLIIINGDLLFDTYHIEQLLQLKNKNALYTKKAYFINEKGIKISVQNNKIKNIISKGVLSLFPWNIYCGLCLLSINSIKKFQNNSKRLKSKSFIHNIEKNISLNEFLNLDYSSVNSQTYEDSSKSIILKGGSYAKLVRKHIVRKEAKGLGKDKLKKEIDWLKNLPKNIAEYFPTVVDDYRDENTVWYDMPWYNNSTLRKNIITGVFDSNKSCEFLVNVFDVMFEKLYSQVIDSNPSETWLLEKYIFRVLERLTISANRSNKIRKLLCKSVIYINEKKLLNIPLALKELLKFESFFEEIKPKKLTLVHGDLHFQNIFVGPISNDKNFLLADPSGDNKGSDYVYDLGKIWHSINGHYDLIHTDLFYLNENSNEKKVSFKFEFNNKDLLKTYQEIKQYLIGYLPYKDKISKSKNWLLKVKFAETMHFCSVLPFHIINDEEERKAIALYLMATILINKLLEDLINETKSESRDLLRFCKYDDWYQNIISHNSVD